MSKAKKQEILDALDFVEDMALSRQDKLRLIAAIPVRQAERLANLKRFRKRFANLPLSIKHTIMWNSIAIIRRQNERLRRLKKLI
jgi:hypothetical protein